MVGDYITSKALRQLCRNGIQSRLHSKARNITNLIAPLPTSGVYQARLQLLLQPNKAVSLTTIGLYGSRATRGFVFFLSNSINHIRGHAITSHGRSTYVVRDDVGPRATANLLTAALPEDTSPAAPFCNAASALSQHRPRPALPRKWRSAIFGEFRSAPNGVLTANGRNNEI